MNQHILPGTPPLEITLRRSKRAKRLSLRVSKLDGRVTLTFPYGLPESQALDFAQEKQDWLRQQQGQSVQSQRVVVGGTVPFKGRLLPITTGKGRRVEIEDVIAIPGDPATAPRRLLGHFKQLARAELALASDHYSERLGKPYNRLTIRDTRSRWGSCSSSGGVMYSWRLIMAPPRVLDYVAAHEVAHLAEMNHSAKFWKTVETLFGDFREPRDWLHKNGHDLHGYRFDH